MKKRLSVIIALIMSVLCAVGLVACKEDPSSNSIDGVYIQYMAEYSASDGIIKGLKTFGEDRLEIIGSVEIEIKLGKYTMQGYTVELKEEGDGRLSYTNPIPEYNHLPEIIYWEKIAEGEYFCPLTANYICKKGKTPSYPIVGVF